MWKWLLIYLICGVVVIGIEWAVLAFGRGRLFESDKLSDKASEGIAFFIEIFIWPYQLFMSIYTTVRFFKGTITEEELYQLRLIGEEAKEDKNIDI